MAPRVGPFLVALALAGGCSGPPAPDAGTRPDAGVDASSPDAGPPDAGDDPHCTQGTAEDAPPVFAGVEGARSDGPDAVVLHWRAASDDRTEVGAIRYRVFVAVGDAPLDLGAPAATARGIETVRVSGLAEGTAYRFVVRAEDAHRYTDKPLYVKALSFVAGNASGLLDPDYDYTHFDECQWAAEDAYAQAGITDPRRQLAMAEVHDCFTPTELVLMEDLGFSARGEAWKDAEAGVFDLHGELPVNTDGGLKSFGHPVGASGLRMLFECWLQLRGEAPEDRRIDTADRGLALTHNLGGYPGEMVSFVGIWGNRPG